MAELVPMPVSRLLHRLGEELRLHGSIYDLEPRKWWRGTPGLDPSVSFLGRPAATAVGPAAGPQSQLIQNLVLAWLAGARIFELKTVQIMDQLVLPRPCIDAHNIGYNVEWSQELRLEQSLAEYIGAWLMLHVLREMDPVGRKAVVAEDPFIFDMSVGYGLEGIRSDRVSRWIDGMRDAGAAIDALRTELRGPFARYRDVSVPDCVSSSITLSTFHGCPPDEIERIGEHILATLDMDLIVKLNPTLLGYDRVVDLLRGTLGYTEVFPVRSAFEEDLQWQDALPLLGRLRSLAEGRGRRFGIKLTNTLVVENRGTFFKDERMYLSGQPLHVLAMSLLWRLRSEARVVGEDLPISFSAGIDRRNFPDAMALGLTPVTTCTDLLRPGGYGRLSGYLGHLEERMAAVGAADVPSYVRRAYGHEGETVAHAAFLNTQDYVAKLAENTRYHAMANRAVPRKIGSHLVLFDCVNCDKCIPVCPNDANFAWTVAPEDREYKDLVVAGDGRVTEAAEARRFTVEKAHQLACYADFCNECGNCDVFCPEDGGPYVQKPKFFGSRDTFMLGGARDGYVLEVEDGGARRLRGRMRGLEVSLFVPSATSAAVFSDGVVELPIGLEDGALGAPTVVRRPAGEHRVELERVFALRAIYLGVVAADAPTWAVAATWHAA